MSTSKHPPYIIFMTGASGAGKTTLLNALKNSPEYKQNICLHFDNIGVPSEKEMTKQYGSPSEWQRAMTHVWIEKINAEYQDTKFVIIEGQVNLDYIEEAFRNNNSNQYKMILVHCDKLVRHQRLNQNRNQPELVNDDLDKWADFLRKRQLTKM
jgi:adenylylsulfate kinase-like enzyme